MVQLVQMVIMAVEFPAGVMNHYLRTVWCSAGSYMISGRFGRHIVRFRGIRSNSLDCRTSEQERGCSLQYLRHCQTLSSLNEVCHWGSHVRIVMQCARGIFMELFSWQIVWTLHSHEPRVTNLTDISLSDRCRLYAGWHKEISSSNQVSKVIDLVDYHVRQLSGVSGPDEPGMPHTSEKLTPYLAEKYYTQAVWCPLIMCSFLGIPILSKSPPK